jgi:hypothetical protein
MAKTSDSACAAGYNGLVLIERTESEVLPLAACCELSENSRLGFAGKVNPQAPGLLCANLQSTLGMHVSLPENRGGLRIQTWNRYAYVGGSPLTAIDRLGLSAMSTVPNCGTSFQCWNQYGQNMSRSHAGGVPSDIAPPSIWAGGGPSVPVQTVASSSELLGLPQWNPSQLVNLPNGDVHLTNGGWSSPSSTINGNSVSGVLFTQTSSPTWTFTSTNSFQQTVLSLKRAGFVEFPQDYANFYHPGQLDLRDKSAFCSQHLD